MTVLSIFLKSSLNFLSNNLKKNTTKFCTVREKTVSQFELTETQFERTVSDKIASQTFLERENDNYKHIFGNLIKFPIQYPEETPQNWVQSGKKTVSKFELAETYFERIVKDKIACKIHLK